MFRRKDEGSTEMFPDAPTDVQVPPAPQAQPDSASSSAYAAKPAAPTFNTASTSSTASSPASATSSTPASPASTSSAASATPYRAAAPATNSNVTDISSRNRYDNNRTTATSGSSFGMDKNTANKPGSRRVLTVGNDILLKGEINTCDRIVIEGAVDATLKDVHTMEIAESGSFKGLAEVEEAEISGTVEGDLTVRGRLIIYSSGKVSGKITYGEIEIERGGQLSGEIKTGAAGAAKKKEAA